jgi:NitT/TauT family transport system ATP-binding protein
MSDADRAEPVGAGRRSGDADPQRGNLLGSIAAHDISKTFSRRQTVVPVINQLSLEVPPGQFTSIVGPSGCGKTTLLRMFAGLDHPDGGTISIDGKSPEELKRGHRLAIAFQDAALLPWRSVEANIRLPLELSGAARTDPKGTAELVEHLVTLVGLQGFASARPAQLSGGMQQRTSIARALAVEPALLLLDEPFASVDEITRRRLNVELLSLLAGRTHGTVLVTHSVAEALFLSQRLLVMSARPMRVLEELKVELPEPRSPDVMRTREFFELTEHVTATLYAALPESEGGSST